jgi:quercetin dioxygenase-like cupin family protein
MIEFIQSKIIENALQKNDRQYLAGDLKLPQELSHIFDADIEVGITKYNKYTVEQPHMHPWTTEYTYIVEGETKYVDIISKREYHFKKGDFYIIRNNTVTTEKSLPGTMIVAVKVPGGNDKTPVDADERIKLWYAAWENIFS